MAFDSVGSTWLGRLSALTTSPAMQVLGDVIGSRITRVRRVHYVFRGVPATDFGPLELAFGDRVVLLDGAADGQALRVSRQAWEDPFAEPLSACNRAFVEKSGKWTAFDVSAEGSLAAFTGDVLASVEPVVAEDGAITGVVLRTRGGGVIRVDVEADELFVSHLIPARPAEGRQLRE